MPDIVIKEDWQLTTGKRKARRGNHDNALILFAKAMLNGRIAATNLKKELGIPASTFDRISTKLKDVSSPLCQQLAEVNVRYAVEGAGRSQRAYLVKGD
jgi:hypothetical protein